MKYRISGDVIRGIYSVGFPSIIMASVGSVMTFGMNKILMGFTSTATAVFGVYFRLQSFVFMQVFGLNNGMVPIVAYNYGARKPKRITKGNPAEYHLRRMHYACWFRCIPAVPGKSSGDIFSAPDYMMESVSRHFVSSVSAFSSQDSVWWHLLCFRHWDMAS